MISKEKTMKPPIRIFSRRGFIMSSLLGGLIAPFLQPDRVEAAQGYGPPVLITALPIPNAFLENITTTFTKIGDIGHFSVQNPASLVEVTHHGRLYIAALIAGTNRGKFELRVDGVPPKPNTGQAYVDLWELTVNVPLTFSGYWNLSAGDHIVSLWVRTDKGTGTSALMNPGDRDTDAVIIKEYLPFGATYLPSVIK